MDSLRRDLATCWELHSLPGNVETAVQQYDSGVGAILDQYAPKKMKTVTVRPEAVWFDDDIHETRMIRRQLERRWRQSGLQVHYQIYCDQCQAVTRLVHAAKIAFYSCRIQNDAGSSNLLFKTVDTLLHRSGESVLSSTDPPSALANNFQNFFLEKVSTIHHGLQSTSGNPGSDAPSWGPKELPSTCFMISF